jgi:Interferon-alpha/beta receptor, fibronectin type III
MSDPVLRLAARSLAAEPGGQVRTDVSVHNPGRVVEGFRLEVVGEPGAWATITPSTVDVYAGAETTATVVFAVPETGAVPSGTFPFGVRAVSVRDNYSSDVAEGDLEVGRVFGIAPKLTPVTSRGRWKGRHTVALTNWGNTPAHVRLTASDPDERLGFLMKPAEVQLALGATRTARLTVRTRHPVLRGTPERLPFQVVAATDQLAERPTAPERGDPQRPVLDGAFLQRPIVSRGTVTVAALAVAALAAGGAWLVTSGGSHAPSAKTGFPPPAPVTTSATPTAKDAVTVTWSVVPQAVSYRVFPTDQNGSLVTGQPLEVQGALTTTIPGLAPVTEYCFRVVAVSAFKKESERADAGCVTTPAPTGDGQLPNPTQWIAARGDFISARVGRANAERTARATRDQLAAAEGISPGVLNTADFAGFGQGQPAFVVYEGPFDAKSDAEAVCRLKTQLRCVPLQPGARVGEPTPSPSDTETPPTSPTATATATATNSPTVPPTPTAHPTTSATATP